MPFWCRFQMNTSFWSFSHACMIRSPNHSITANYFVRGIYKKRHLKVQCLKHFLPPRSSSLLCCIRTDIIVGMSNVLTICPPKARFVFCCSTRVIHAWESFPWLSLTQPKSVNLLIFFVHSLWFDSWGTYFVILFAKALLHWLT
jgi:hypothetical protein